ncbi:MAG: hypothetical protein K2V38_03615 [Gemmataceae bacterium]|nr:hypothetical protein [Gemmataceae bacterium]
MLNFFLQKQIEGRRDRERGSRLTALHPADRSGTNEDTNNSRQP